MMMRLAGGAERSVDKGLSASTVEGSAGIPTTELSETWAAAVVDASSIDDERSADTAVSCCDVSTCGAATAWELAFPAACAAPPWEEPGVFPSVEINLDGGTATTCALAAELDTGGFTITGPDGGRAAIAGAGGGEVTICGACRGKGTILRGPVVAAGVLAAGVRALDPAAFGVAETVSTGEAGLGAGAEADSEEATRGRCDVGGVPRCAASRCSFCCWMARRTSPGLEMFDRSIFGFWSLSVGLVEEAVVDFPPRRKAARTRTASSSSTELECVFFSVTPTSGRMSRMTLLLTSSSRARSLIRTLLIRLFRLFPNF